MGMADKLLSQCKKPRGWLGRFNVWSMNFRHSKLTDWGLQHVPIGKNNTILDVGCGGGKTIAKLAATAAEGKVYGIDYSEASVAVARRTNKRRIRTGQVEIRQGSVSQLPYPDDTFDLATAVETHYFWPDLPADMREVLRVLKPSGTLIIIAEAYRGGKKDHMVEKAAALIGMVCLTVDEHRQLFLQAGYSDVQIIERYEKGWICAMGRKSS
jgi:ubiquinone/menaquinone biosynthesis C-methylase UbiE